MSSPPSLSRHSSLAERISSVLPPIRSRLPSLRSRKSTTSISSRVQPNQRSNARHRPYSVYQQTMSPIILRDPDTLNKLLVAVLDSPGGRRSLSRLARTCKAIKEPALNVLWRDLDSLTPLLGLFPHTLLKRARRPGLGLTKNPEPDDWAKLLAYGERVRSISYVEPSGAISPSIFPILDELRPRTWILPNLTSLTWKSETSAGLERCRLFLGPELQNLTMEVGTKHPKLHDLLVEIASHTGLTSFAFTLHTNLPDNFTDIFEHNVALERVSIAAPGAVSARIGRWAASLPRLRSFHIDLNNRTTTAVEGFFDEISVDSGFSTPTSVGGTDSGVASSDELDFTKIRKSAMRLTRDGSLRGAFAQLSHLQLSGEASNISAFLKHLTSPLVHLELAIDDPPDSDDWQDVCALICDQFSFTLQALRVGPTPAARFSELVRSTSRGGDAPLYHLPLVHLSSLPVLHRLDIDLPESVVFLDEDVAHLSRMCPSLETLRLCPLARFPPTLGAPPLTLSGLAPLTRNCRRLHTLAVVVNALDGLEEIYESRSSSSRSLLRLQVGNSWIKDPLQTSILLSHLAPRLDSLKWFHEKNRAGVVEANAVAWQKVSEFLPHLQKVRLMERKQQPQPQVYVPPETAEKGVDAIVSTMEQGMLACPEVVDGEVQATVKMVDCSVQISPQRTSVSVDATPVLVDTGILFVPTLVEQAVDACPATDEMSNDYDDDGSSIDEYEMTSSMFSYLQLPATSLRSLSYRVAQIYKFPFNYVFSLMPSGSSREDSESTVDSDVEHLSGEPSDSEETELEKRASGTSEDFSQSMDVFHVGL
ncbi:uncharacterized protein LAESUDRAFT_201781 [Laetiporus sulphureus 93-53]|uniref:F-box domain-containing protein n=1 Tax=Laetiporus sulphureus 93-53 TaxID=1314785 RepID=A0A165DXH6_9APHY|nr:uncharacterized protein LAESUDRAFT_201781 [Laetiporus sulphureus 93-53]KZT05825.1 hypothetical protein LAESUDRAFT_201781 [Laetiporus sulphureus 93-53]